MPYMHGLLFIVVLVVVVDALFAVDLRELCRLFFRTVSQVRCAFLSK